MIEKRKIEYLVFILGFFVVFLELLTRTYFFISENDVNAFRKYPGRYQGSHFTGYKLTENWELNHKTLVEKVNSLGFKSPEIPIKKKKNTYRVICIGGSLVYGRDNQTTWPYYLNQFFNKEYTSSDIQFEVINAGVPGYTSFHTLSQFTTKLIDLNPDLIISYQLFTDLWYYDDLEKGLIIGDSFHPYSSRLSVDKIIDKSYFLILCKAIKNKYYKNITDNERLPESITTKVINDNVLMYYNRNIDIMASICQLFKIDLLLCTPISLFKEDNNEEEEKMITDIENIEFYLDYIKTGKRLLKNVSKKYDRVYYFDPSTKINPTLKLLSDRYHPNVEGNKRIAKEIHSFISKEINRD